MSSIARLPFLGQTICRGPTKTAEHERPQKRKKICKNSTKCSKWVGRGAVEGSKAF